VSDRAFPIITVGDLGAGLAFYERLGFEQSPRASGSRRRATRRAISWTSAEG
jgi:hypothetical protein